MITGTARKAGSPLSLRNSSNPLRPGIIASSRITAGNSRATRLTGCSPSSPRITWWPPLVSLKALISHSRRGLLLLTLALLGFSPLQSQQAEGDSAWSQGRFEAARAAYARVLVINPRSVRANLRMGTLLSWQGKLDSALMFLGRARAVDPADQHVRLAQAQVMAWNKQYDDALLRYDSLLAILPGSRDALLGRARTLSWAGRLGEAQTVYRDLMTTDSTDRDAVLGAAQVSAWKGDLPSAERGYRALLARNSRDLDARVGLGYVYLWEGRDAAAGRQAVYALGIDSTYKAARQLRRVVRSNTRPAVEATANWSNDSDHNTS